MTIYHSIFNQNIPPSRVSFDRHSTGRNSTWVAWLEKCLSSIFLAASLILSKDHKKQKNRKQKNKILSNFTYVCILYKVSLFITFLFVHNFIPLYFNYCHTKQICNIRTPHFKITFLNLSPMISDILRFHIICNLK